MRVEGQPQVWSSHAANCHGFYVVTTVLGETARSLPPLSARCGHEWIERCTEVRARGDHFHRTLDGLRARVDRAVQRAARLAGGGEALEHQRGLAAEIVDHGLEEHQDRGNGVERHLLETIGELAKLGDSGGAPGSDRGGGGVVHQVSLLAK
jgi:hypothetical protein